MNMNKGLMFPDDLFDIKDLELYQKTVSAGYIVAKEKRILFCGICRNVGDHLERNILRIKFSASFFKDYHIFIYENDSNDNTKDILEKYNDEKLDFVSESRNDKNYQMLIDGGHDPCHYNRCKVLASCRNKYMDYIDKHEDYDIVCVLDLDLWGGWSYNGLLHSVAVLYNREENGAVTAYGVLSDPYNRTDLEENDPRRYIMYDCFAFRPNGEYKAVKKVSTGRFNFINQRPGSNAAFVNSNFNGLALYKREAISGLKYHAKKWDEESVDCEHISLHHNIKQKGWDIIFNPSLLVSYAHHKYSRIPLNE